MPTDLSTPETTLELRHAHWTLQVDPAMGGSVRGLWLDGVPVLRPTPAGVVRAGESAAYPLVPYSNRIGQGRMVWRGETHTLRNGFNAEPHALQGVGFMRPWAVVTQTPSMLVLRLVHSLDAFWPFGFEAEQRFELGAEGLDVTLSARNTDPRTQPMGLGWHPFFVRRPDSAVNLPVHTQWLAGEDLLPREHLAVQGLSGPVSDLLLDHCFAGHGGPAQLSDGQLDLSLESDGRYWVVYTPADADFYCVEPVTHLNNAVQQADPLEHGLVSLDTGAELRLHVRLRGQVSPL